MPRRATVTVVIERVLDEYGRWCPSCALPSAVRRTFAAHSSGRTAVGVASLCLDCGRTI